MTDPLIAPRDYALALALRNARTDLARAEERLRQAQRDVDDLRQEHRALIAALHRRQRNPAPPEDGHPT